jgi:hypothetical protein
MWDKCFCAAIPSVRTILDIEDQIRQFELDIPTCLRSPSVQVALTRPYLLFQVRQDTSEDILLTLLLEPGFDTENLPRSGHTLGA